MKKKLPLLSSALLLGLVLGPKASASLQISYSVGGVGPMLFADVGQPGDTVEIQPYSSNLTLTENTPTTAKINNLQFVVNYTWPQGQWAFSADRWMTINMAGPQTLTQSGVFDSWLTYNPQDAVWLLMGGTTTFTFAGIGKVAVTPLDAGPFKYGDLGTYNNDIEATFLFTPVPEPTTVVAGALLLLPFGLSTLRMIRKNRAA